MTFEKLYDNPLVTTALPCLVALATLAWAWTRGKGMTTFVRAYATVFAVEIAADAFLNNRWSPVHPGSTLATTLSVAFVILGDFRYFVLLEEASSHTLKLVRAVVWAFVVPVSAQVVRWVFPRLAEDDRSTFLLYELFFFALALGIRVFHVKRLRDPRLGLRATRFELLQYGTWIAADIGLMTLRSDLFNALRVVANLLYYAAFLPLMLWALMHREKDERDLG